MAAGDRVQGRCLCGAMSFAATLGDGAMHACHCDMCRRWAGGPFLYLPIDPVSLELTGGDAVGRYRSSGDAERGFCKVCGSTMFWRALDGRSADVSSQAVDDPGRFPFESEVFYEEKPANYEFANPTRKWRGNEIAAWRESRTDG